MKFLKKIKIKFRNWLLSSKIISIEDFHNNNYSEKVEIPDNNGKIKFIESAVLENIYTENNFGLVEITRSLKTIKYDIWHLKLEDGCELKCADEHLVFTKFGFKQVMNLKITDHVRTKDGWSKLKSLEKLNLPPDHMYDLEINDKEHTYFSNNILSHNTTIIAMFLLWFASFQFDKQVLVASNKNGNAMEVMARIKYAYEEMPHWLKPGIHYYTKHSMEFDNGSKIWSEATTENTGRGKSLSLILIDELAYVPIRMQEAMWMSLAPTLSTGGGCIVSSTPNGDQELFSQLWREAKLDVNGFVPIEVQWHQCSHYDERGNLMEPENFKQMMIKKIGETLWSQEYCNEFLSGEALLINTRLLQMLKSSPPLYIDKGIKIWEEPKPDKTYIIGMDISEGIGKDFSTIQVLELESLTQIMEYRSNSVNETQLYNCLKYIIQLILSSSNNSNVPTIYWSFENNSVGATISVLYQNDELFPDSPELISTGTKLGMNTSAKSKAIACKILKRLIEKKINPLVINSEQLLMELKSYVQHGAAYAAKKGATDDLISAMLIVVREIEFLSEYEGEIFNKIYNTEEEFYEETGDDFDEPVPFLMS